MNTLTDPLEDRIRRTLHAVADTVTDAPSPIHAPPVPERKRSRWKWPLVVGAVAVPLTLAAGAHLRSGPEYVDAIPKDTIVLKGEVDGSSYLLAESRRTSTCGEPVPGVEFVVEDKNLLGSEWNTSGLTYGAGSADGCDLDTASYLANPALFNDGGTLVGDTFVWVWAVHPDVTAVRVTADGLSVDVPTHRVDGAGYAVYEVPKDLTSYTSELLVGDVVVPGSSEVQRLTRH
ncbi:hypothetical protein [Nocardioides sp. WS12]|uniref:hypothetical protein n=1 Tax=Nocardioides sp. WS12 TaxID=2486272 RepID=UPI0015FD498D|nr:hypothetical protein [Nocardioides sp. WS12]